MSGHAIRWEWSPWQVDATLVCTAASDADCHLMPTCDCEEWGEILTGTYGGGLTGALTYRYHVPQTYDGEPAAAHAPRHVMNRVDGWCTVAEWLNNSDDLLGDGQGHVFTIAETPVEPVWVLGGYQWKRQEAKGQ